MVPTVARQIALKRGLYGRFREIKRLAELFLRGDVNLTGREFVRLIKEYNSAVEALGAYKDEIGGMWVTKISHEDIVQEAVKFIHSMPTKDLLKERLEGIINNPLLFRPLLIKVLTGCEEALGILESIAWPNVHPRTLNALKGLRDSLTKLKEEGIDHNIYVNLFQAISECENGHYLASALITSRSIVYMIEQMGGNRPTEEIVKMLVDTGLIPKDRKDEQRELLMAVRTARNFLAHRVNVYAGPDDALLLLGASVKLARIYLKWLQKER